MFILSKMSIIIIVLRTSANNSISLRSYWVGHELLCVANTVVVVRHQDIGFTVCDEPVLVAQAIATIVGCYYAYTK